MSYRGIASSRDGIDLTVRDLQRRITLLERGKDRGPNSSFAAPFKLGGWTLDVDEAERLVGYFGDTDDVTVIAPCPCECEETVAAAVGDPFPYTVNNWVCPGTWEGDDYTGCVLASGTDRRIWDNFAPDAYLCQGFTDGPASPYVADWVTWPQLRAAGVTFYTIQGKDGFIYNNNEDDPYPAYDCWSPTGWGHLIGFWFYQDDNIYKVRWDTSAYFSHGTP